MGARLYNPSEVKRLMIFVSSFLLVISFFMSLYVPDEHDIVSSVNESFIGKTVVVRGIVVYQKHYDWGTVGLINTGSSKIRVYAPGYPNISDGEFKGRVKEYNGKLELLI